jgi:hypothetical protein
MTTTTGADLINRADRLARDVARCNHPVEAALWDSFDTTAYRLMRELIGPGRDDAGACTRQRATLLQVIHAYPTPLRPPLDAEFSVNAAMRFVATSGYEFKERIRDGGVPTSVVNGRHMIHAADLDTRPDITPADPTDPHPLALLSVSLGALAVMVSEERCHPGTVHGLSDDTVRDATARVMAWLAVAGRYTLRHGPINAGARPLAIAQYAERSIGILGQTTSPAAGLEAISAGVATTGPGLSERLDSALQHWATEARNELKRTIPSTQVMANIASIGTLTMATTHRLHTLSPTTSADELVAMTSDLRGAADALKAAEAAWKSVTTLQPQGRAFGIASYELFDALRRVLATPAEPETLRTLGLDVKTSLRSLERGARELARFVEQSHDATRACLNSELLFAPARGRDNAADHLRARIRGEHLAVLAHQAQATMEWIARAEMSTRAVTALGVRSATPPLRAPCHTIGAR